MATRREDILVSLGGDSKVLLKELNMSRQQVNTWARQISADISTGHIPEAWKSYSKNATAALNQVETKGKESVSKFGSEAGKMLAKVGTAFIAAFSVQKIIASFREVAKEIGELDKQFDASPYIRDARRKQLEGMSATDRENVVAGNVQTQGLWSGVKDFMAKSAGLYAFGADIVRTKFTEKNAAGLPMNFQEAAVRAMQHQKEILEGVKLASAEQQAAEAAKKAEKDKGEQQKKNAKELSDWMKENVNQRHQEKFHLERALELRRKITAEIARQVQIQRKIQDHGVLGYKAGFMETVGEVSEPTGIAYPDMQNGINDYNAKNKERMDRWAAHVKGMSPEAIRANVQRSVRPQRDAAGSAKTLGDVVTELGKLTGPIERNGALPVKIELDE